MNKFYLVLLNIIFVASSLFAEDKKEENNKCKYALIISAGTLSAAILSYLTFQHFKRKHNPTPTEKALNILKNVDKEFPKLHAITSVAENIEADKNTLEEIEDSVKSEVNSKINELEESVEEVKHHITESLNLAESKEKNPEFFAHINSHHSDSPKITPIFDYLEELDYIQEPPRRK